MSETPTNRRIDADRLWAAIHAMAEIGPGVAGGSNRQTLTDADAEGRRLFQRWCEEAGLTMAVDTMGTMFMTRPGAEPELPAVMIGSHLDTQPTGGRYDGVLGVLGALEVVRTMNDLGIATRRPVTIVNWTNEEGTRFAPAMMASGVFAGRYEEAWANARTDADGLTFGDALDRIGWRGAEPVGRRPVHAYLELHIEQGPILEAEGCDIGVVTHGQGQRWIECRLTGRESHAGSTPMALRRDAALAMARIVELVNRVALDHAPAVGTVGHVEVHPNSRNVIAGGVTLTIDIRSHELAKLQAMEEAIGFQAPALCKALGVDFRSEIVGRFDPPAFDEGLVASIRAAAERLGYAHRDIVSGAGHDACWINEVAPAAMIMCPCQDGLSHNEEEAITLEWARAGTDVLLHATLEAAGTAG